MYYLITHSHSDSIYLGKAESESVMYSTFIDFCDSNLLEREFELISVDSDPKNMLPASNSRQYWDRWLDSPNYPILNVSHLFRK